MGVVPVYCTSLIMRCGEARRRPRELKVPIINTFSRFCRSIHPRATFGLEVGLLIEWAF